MNKSDSIKELASALAKAQADMLPAKLNETNPFLKSKYASLGAVIEASRPALAKHGLSVAQFPFNDGDTIGVRTVLMHESGEYMEDMLALPVGDEKGKSVAQVAGSVITYLRRYALSSVLGIYAGEDDDGSVETPAPKKKAPSAPPSDKPKSLMTLEMAEDEVGSDGVRYGDKDSETLAYMLNSITKAMEKDLTEAERERYQMKKDACLTILNHRAGLQGG